MIEKSGFCQNKRSNAGSGDLSTFSVPLTQLYLGIIDVAPPEGRDQLIGRAGGQRRNDDPLRL
jgi:hypothetical protein